MDAMFEMPSKENQQIIITKKYAHEKIDKQDIKRLKVA